jgi:hypothetical protein
MVTDEFYDELKACYRQRGLPEPTREEVERGLEPPAWWPIFKRWAEAAPSQGVPPEFVPGKGFPVAVMLTQEELRRFEVSRGGGYQPVETGATRVPPSSAAAASEDCVFEYKLDRQWKAICDDEERDGEPPCDVKVTIAVRNGNRWEEEITGRIKRDGCSDWGMGQQTLLHFCGMLDSTILFLVTQDVRRFFWDAA